MHQGDAVSLKSRSCLCCMQGWNVYVHVGDAVQRYNADEFMPERWIGSGCPHRPEYSLPFGAGPRRCLGQHLVEAALRSLLLLFQQYTWDLQDVPEQWSVFPTVRPKGGLQVKGFRKLDA